MPVYSYIAADGAGRRLCGTLAADTPAIARRMLRERGVRLLEFQSTRFRPLTLTLWFGERRRQQDAAEFARQMALLLRTGVPVVEALDVLIREQRGNLLAALRDIRDRVAAGSRLSEALAEHPWWFDRVFCSAAEVGQLSGRLEQALADLAAFMLERQGMRNRIFMALAYPAILSVLGLGVVIFLMSYVVPQLLQVLETSGRPIPAATAWLKNMSDVLVTHWLVLLVSGGVLLLATAMASRWERGIQFLHRLQLRIPLLGPLIRKSVVAQFSQMMALLLKSGVTFLEALRLVRSITRHRVLVSELAAMEAAVIRGSDIAASLESSRIFPPLVTHIFSVGQTTGELPEMLAQLNDGYATEVRVAVGKFSAALEPLLIVIMSAVVGFVVFATMMPILEATRGIQ